MIKHIKQKFYLVNEDGNEQELKCVVTSTVDTLIGQFNPALAETIHDVVAKEIGAELIEKIKEEE